ncbi:hypothetical protein BTA51_01190 [Hahella sp. CCB-MM4]|uniref:hypothetical protein n=1 Tax=Hahella sp. (strain CCB-MM4) TaxID=1926491 RepID=UPI000B9A7719|nr:hypothetical protein [Hahella sp. CCB-MM4]OZG75045.1 hypothetical protein BTA51_01190 [Hahella sp. CCB-MM4]
MQHSVNFKVDSPDSERFLNHPQLVWSNLYQCELYVWLASGERRSKSGQLNFSYWLYVEYRDRFGRARYSQFRFSLLDSVAHFIADALPQESLHEIDPVKTGSQPIGMKI